METHIANRGATADYAQLLAEAAYVLSALAESPTTGRREEFIVLQAIYAESTLNPVAFGSSTPVTAGLRSMFSSVMAIGAVLTPYDDDELPLTAIAGVHIAESMTRCLAQFLDGGVDTGDVVRGALALDQTLTAPDTDGLLEAVRVADQALSRFVTTVCALN